MARLNEKNAVTAKIIHIVLTTMCARNCPLCCNKQYDMDAIEHVTDEELKYAETLCLTGGEPFMFANPCETALYYKQKYKNIKNVYVYTNALELAEYLKKGGQIYAIDGVNVSIKTPLDAGMFRYFIKDNPAIRCLSSNLLYVFDELYDGDAEGFTVKPRKWQTTFDPATDSIFRRA